MSQELLEAYKSLFTSLWDKMATMLGKITTYSLMDRALFETAKKCPLSSELVLQEGGLDFTRLEQTMGELDIEVLRECLNSLVVNLVAVLAEQVGKTIADQIAKKAVMPE